MKNTAVSRFIEDSLKGGYKGIDAKIADGQMYTFGKRIVESELLLDPFAWQAVSETREWEKPKTYWTYQNIKGAVNLLDAWECNMHTFLQALIEQETVEQALTAIE